MFDETAAPEGSGPDWMKKVEDKARNIGSDLPRERAIQVATELYLEVSKVDKRIPYAIIFASEGIDGACSKLLQVFNAPDETISSSQQITEKDLQSDNVKDRLRTLLQNVIGDSDRIVASSVAGSFIGAIANKGEKFTFYQDDARLFPVSADSWRRDLIREFGSEVVMQAEERNSDFFSLLDQSEKLAEKYGKPPGTPEDVARSIGEYFNVAAEHGYETVNKWQEIHSDKTFGDYRQEAYAIRGLSYSKR